MLKILSTITVVVMMLFVIAALRGANSVSAADSIHLPSQAYNIQELSNGNLRTHVQVNFDDRVERERYVEQQRTYALKLAGSVHGSIPVQVTFRNPLSIEELRLLTKEVSLIVEFATFEVRDADNNLHTAAAVVDDINLFEPANLPPGPAEYEFKIIGVMVVRGTVEASGLQKLATDERIYLPDVMPYLLATELARQYPNVSVQQIQVDVPSPHWYLSTERGRLGRTGDALHIATAKQ